MQAEEHATDPRTDCDRAGLLRDVQPLVVRATRLIVGSGSAVGEEAAQEALVAIWRGIRPPSDPRAFRAWAVTIATRTAIRYAKRERRIGWLTRDRLDANDDHIPARAETDLVELKEAFDSLPPKQRAVAGLRLYAGLSEAETAAAVGCSVGTVKSQLHDARRALRRYLGPADLSSFQPSRQHDPQRGK
jgi:RNA polymerase sigma-70 factor (ECF subfamily)